MDNDHLLDEVEEHSVVDMQRWPRVDAGLVQGHPLNQFKGWGITTRQDIDIQLVSLHQTSTYYGLLVGLPQDLKGYCRTALDTAARVYSGQSGKPLILACPILTGRRVCKDRDADGTITERIESWSLLPPVTSIALFFSNQTARDHDETCSSLVVIWFQDEYGPPTPSIIEQLKNIDWSAQAQDWTW